MSASKVMLAEFCDISKTCFSWHKPLWSGAHLLRLMKCYSKFVDIYKHGVPLKLIPQSMCLQDARGDSVHFVYHFSFTAFSSNISFLFVLAGCVLAYCNVLAVLGTIISEESSKNI